MPDSKSVIPLESNPEVFTALAHKLGLSPVVSFHDVFSLTDPDLLAFLPQPVLGLVMLFPITAPFEDYRKQQDSQNANDSQNALWFQQTIGNACGLYALLHLLANLPPDLVIKDSMVNQLLLSKMRPGLAQRDVAQLVESLEQHIQLDANYGSQGQTAAPDAGDPVEFHFIAFVKGRDNHMYELDGRRTGPVDLGESTADAHILNDPKVAQKIQFYMDQVDDVQQNNFALMAVAPALA